MVRLRLHLALLLLAAPPAGAQENSGQLPDGKGKQALQKVCSGCHELETVTGSLRTRIGWQQSVDDMIARGAEGSDSEIAAVVEYLTAFFGKINVNTASAKELETSLGLSPKEAEAIVGYREKNGSFKSFEQLKTVPGVSGEKLQGKRNRIAFTQ